MALTDLTIATLPWLATMLVFLGIVTYVPELSLDVITNHVLPGVNCEKWPHLMISH